MVTCQSANLKTPAKVSWAFKMVSQFGSLGYTIMGKTADLTVVQKTSTSIQEFGWTSQGMDWGWGQGIKASFGNSCCQRRLTWAKEKKNWTVAQLFKVLFSDESKFCISFGNQGPRVWRKGGEAHSPSCLKSSGKFPQSVIIWGAMSSAGVGPLCFFK